MQMGTYIHTKGVQRLERQQQHDLLFCALGHYKLMSPLTAYAL
jgi:hypothetical protein